ncbi:Propionyl-CoA carboxylase beta chain, mitochondrial [Nocardia seriolae]|uniref:Propionyl-CoA carboxylase beta chain, mitochondrial n=1 Tax=Nocardia seriolae TaxID=37332 RepID=A0ABC8B3S4_9NOCA|nr:Propionyl-CoA carboxylase beta chain, mitochondrial [Nocardia seriolae]OJF82347.1 hypothetical protein NS14008_28355 [Nocardia seriolae]
MVVISHDQTVYGGSVGVTSAQKFMRALQFAFDNACPVVTINDSGGARIQDAVGSIASFGDISRVLAEAYWSKGHATASSCSRQIRTFHWPQIGSHR